MNLLIVEPDRVLADIYVAAFRNEGMTVLVCNSAESAIQNLDSTNDLPELIVLEPQLATHNGVEFIYELHSYPEWQQIPIIIHTVVPLDSIEMPKKQLKTLGIVEYLYKPTTSLNRLVAAVEQTFSVKV